MALTQPMSEARTVTVELDGRPVDVVADRRRLQQVLLNLVSNALRFSSPGTTVTIRTDAHRQPGAATIHVIDQGPGIPGDLLDRLF
ncbi:MAG: sensor histidine kinase, partial [Acidimicrobiia bacterium]